MQFTNANCQQDLRLTIASIKDDQSEKNDTGKAEVKRSGVEKRIEEKR